MRSKIEMQGNGALRHLLGITTVQTNPEEIELSTVSPVVEMSMQGFSTLHRSDLYQSVNATGLSLVGLQTKTVRILSQGNPAAAPFDQSQIVYNLSSHFVLFGITFTIATDAAGAASLANKRITGNIELVMPDGNYVKKWRGTMLGNSESQHYHPGMIYCSPLSTDNLKLVPNGCSLNIVVYIENGSAFPNGTTLEWSLGGMNIPIGAPIPIGV